MKSGEQQLRIGADVGGTFTDVILMNAEGRVWTHKVPSTPPDFEQAVLQAVEELLSSSELLKGEDVREVAHGTTVATNAVLEHLGAKTALVTTEGFRDVFEIRRLRAPQLFNLFFEKPRTLVERYLRFELPERMSAHGEVLKPLRDEDLAILAEKLRHADIESVAVCLLHSYAYPEHEQRVGAFLRKALPHLDVSISCDVLRERKEYERTATTVVNAYVRPIMKRYLDELRQGLLAQGIEATLQIMQSSGGLTPDQEASNRPVYILESGPAAGVLAARFVARHMGIRNLIAFDMGGTTAKASLIEDGEISYNPEYEVGASLSRSNRLVGGAGELIRVPTIDIAEVGAGGGSIAYLDRAGGLHVGPRSAGARPGPACYQRGGTSPTLTDANVVLGYIRPGALANGDVKIDVEAARRVIYDDIAKPLGLGVMESAEGIHRIANAVTMRALREVSTQRGRDPRLFSLIAFGGSGPIQAAGLGRDLGVPRIIVPPVPGLFSAVGLLFSDVEHHDVRSCLLVGHGITPEALNTVCKQMCDEMLQRFKAEGYADGLAQLDCSLDMRYKGQFSEIRVPLGKEQVNPGDISRLRSIFELEHEKLYGHRAGIDSEVEVVAVRLVGRIAPEITRAALRPTELQSLAGASSSREAYFGSKYGLMSTPVIARSAITGSMEGPILVDEYDSTIVVPPGMHVTRDAEHNIIMEFDHV